MGLELAEASFDRFGKGVIEKRHNNLLCVKGYETTTPQIDNAHMPMLSQCFQAAVFIIRYPDG